ncbi:hypothetical protein Pst134EA_009606 [Puccinia striiformis f. sp. tritici]|uniref:hypothetical protein n=1 Tax=Puccinia striiformis f. sp. tritici TaxID=168172 RepID=UPI002007FFAF|nr:hypothetical protein Pst134EA_009606 [Puccinia striiformis f. sp. tritici]KAH9469083.1 hypothetical protein Pst134EA_009606 [Puccinia striiformis f. sp. tritici]
MANLAMKSAAEDIPPSAELDYSRWMYPPEHRLHEVAQILRSANPIPGPPSNMIVQGQICWTSVPQCPIFVLIPCLLASYTAYASTLQVSFPMGFKNLIARSTK